MDTISVFLLKSGISFQIFKKGHARPALTRPAREIIAKYEKRGKYLSILEQSRDWILDT